MFLWEATLQPGVPPGFDLLASLSINNDPLRSSRRCSEIAHPFAPETIFLWILDDGGSCLAGLSQDLFPRRAPSRLVGVADLQAFRLPLHLCALRFARRGLDTTRQQPSAGTAEHALARAHAHRQFRDYVFVVDGV